MKVAIIRWRQKVAEVRANGKPNPTFKRPMRIENVTECGEGPHFVHIFCTPSPGFPISEVNFNSDIVESVTLVNEDELLDKPLMLGPDGQPVSGDEVQSAEQLPVEQDDAGSTPVVPAI